MRLYQTQLVLLVPDESLLHFRQIKNIICFSKHDILHLGWVLCLHLMEPHCYGYDVIIYIQIGAIARSKRLDLVAS